jgi:hypothetical protein
MDDINHTALPKEVVRPNTPTVRPQTEDIWKHVRRIAKHDVPDRAMKTECTHVCVYRLDDEDGEKRYCNTPLKLFRASSAKAAPWSKMRCNQGAARLERHPCRCAAWLVLVTYQNDAHYEAVPVRVRRRERSRYRNKQGRVERLDCSGDCLGCNALDYRVPATREALEPGVWVLVQGVDYQDIA